MFVDACAIISMMAGEPTAAAYQAALETSDARWTSPLAAWEVVVILARPDQLNCPFGAALSPVLEWLDNRGIEVRQPADAYTILSHAVAVAERHGVSKRSLSALDCFHYAYAKTADDTMLTLDEQLRATDVETKP